MSVSLFSKAKISIGNKSITQSYEVCCFLFMCMRTHIHSYKSFCKVLPAVTSDGNMVGSGLDPMICQQKGLMFAELFHVSLAPEKRKKEMIIAFFPLPTAASWEMWQLVQMIPTILEIKFIDVWKNWWCKRQHGEDLWSLLPWIMGFKPMCPYAKSP